MGILKYLPVFKVLEINRSTGLVIGHVLSQFENGIDLTLVTKNGVNFIENGIIVGLSNDLTVENFDVSKHAKPFIVFTEELNTFMPGLKYFADQADEDGNFHPRAVALYVGDAFTTNNYSGVYTNQTFANVVDGVLTLQTEMGEDTMFTVSSSTLPDGSTALKFVFIGVVPVVTYNITYNLDGGINHVDNPDTFVFEDLPITLGVATKGSYTFDGWFLDEALTIAVTEIDSPGSITLYAGFTAITHTVTYNLNGGNIEGVTDDVVVTDVLEGTLVGSAYTGGAPVMALNTWTSPYWVTTSGGDIDAASLPVTADITVYAYWVVD